MLRSLGLGVDVCFGGWLDCVGARVYTYTLCFVVMSAPHGSFSCWVQCDVDWSGLDLSIVQREVRQHGTLPTKCDGYAVILGLQIYLHYGII